MYDKGMSVFEQKRGTEDKYKHKFVFSSDVESSFPMRSAYIIWNIYSYCYYLPFCLQFFCCLIKVNAYLSKIISVYHTMVLSCHNIRSNCGSLNVFSSYHCFKKAGFYRQ